MEALVAEWCNYNVLLILLITLYINTTTYTFYAFIGLLFYLLLKDSHQFILFYFCYKKTNKLEKIINTNIKISKIIFCPLLKKIDVYDFSINLLLYSFILKSLKSKLKQ